MTGVWRGMVELTTVQRSTRMTAAQQRAWEQLWSRFGRDLAEFPEGPVDFEAWFGRSAPVVLEIGSGMGEGIAAFAAAAPDVDHVAVEVYAAGLGQLMLALERDGLDNARLIRGDGVRLLRDHIAPGSLAGVRAFFPDPWPKKRHHKRRLVKAAFVELVASRLAPGGTLHLATDWQPYADEMLAVCSTTASLRNLYDAWAPRPSWRPVTKFEQRAIREGRVCRDLLFEKV